MLLRKTKSCCYENLNVKIIEDNKKLWKHGKPLVVDKEIMNNFFNHAVFTLDVNRELHTDVSTSSGPVISAIEKYKNHPSILKLNERMPNLTFNFQSVLENDMLCMIQSIDSTKALQKNDIPPNILKANEGIRSVL